MKHTPHNLATRTLSALALATLLLTGCTQDKTTSAPSSKVTQSISAGSPSDQATSTPTPTPSPSESISYSGGSKAPAGEYRPADEFGPAQNVPRPVEPEGMNVESVEGMLAFIDYWTEARNYANQTGNAEIIRGLVHESFETEFKFYNALEFIYDSEGWVIGGNIKIHYNKNLITSLGGGEYSIGSNFEVQDSVLWVNGEARAYDNSDLIYRGVDLRLIYIDSQWKMLSATEVN